MENPVFNIADAKTHLSRIIERVEAGEEITIARNHRPVAIISAVRKNVEEMMADLDTLRERIRAENGGRSVLEPGETWRDLIHEGHRI